MDVSSFILELFIISLTYSVVRGSVPTDFSMSLETVDPWPQGKTEVYIGDTVPMRLTISFPELTDASKGTRVEILTSVNPTIFALTKFDQTNNFTKGENLGIGQVTWINDSTTHPGFDQTLDNMIVYNTRIVLNLGDVTNNPGSDVTKDNQLVLDYELVHVAMGGHEDGHEEFTSAGMEYNDESRIFVVQLPLQIHTAKPKDDQNATLELENDTLTDVEVMKPVTFGMRLTLPHPSNDVTVTVPVQPNTMYAHKIAVREVGDAFKYSVNPNLTSTAAVASYSSCPLENDLILRLGPFVSRQPAQGTPETPSSYYDVTVEVTVVVVARDVANASVVATGHVVVNNEEPMRFDVTLLVEEPPLPTTDGVSYDFIEPVNKEVAKGFPGIATLNITTPANTYAEYTIKFNMTRELYFVAANPVHFGVNMPCGIRPHSIKLQNTSESWNQHAHHVVFSVFNSGQSDDVYANAMTVDVVVMMKGASDTGNHDLHVQIDDGPTYDVTFTAGNDSEYDDPVQFDTSVTTKCPAARYQSGTVVSFQVTVATQRDVTPGPLTVEAPIPYNLTNSTLAFQSASVMTKGRNVVCVQLGPVSAATSKWDVDSEGEEDRAVMTFPLVCNKEIVNDKAEDEFVIQIRVRIKDTDEILAAQGDVTVEFGIGIQYSGSQVWVATHYFLVAGPIDLLLPDVTHVQRVTGIRMNASSTSGKMAEDTVLQWSADNQKYYDMPIDLNSAEGILSRPLIPRYVRVTNNKGMCMDPPLLDYTTVDVPEMYGSVGKSGPLLQKLMLTLDDDDDTCIQLPTKDWAETTPYLWMESKTSVFGISGTANFSVRLSGRGLVPCAERGPQLTYVTFPKVRSSKRFEGNKVICPPDSPETTPAPPGQDRFVCQYACSCVDEEQCERFSLLMLHTNGGGNYSLCSIDLLE